MADQVTNYKCPNCTGPLHFDGATGKLVCDYCGSSYEVSEIETLYAEKDRKAAEEERKADERKAREQYSEGDGQRWDFSGTSGDWGADAGKMKVYNCPSCGAELICDETTGATSCPYCGNPTIVPGTFAGGLRPEYVIPFKLSKDDAIAALKTHYKGKLFLPGTFKSENHLEEMKGIYVPFWLFDGTADGWADFEGTRVHVHTSGDYEITETEYFDVHRKGELTFSKVPVDASSRMPDDYMDSIEPYNYQELKSFSTAFLPGFLADKYDVTAEEVQKRADVRCENTLLSALEQTVTGYDTVMPRGQAVRLRRGKAHYALLPVWTLHTKWNGKDFLFAMNGQTGKLVGDLPVSRGKFWGLFAGLAAVLSTISTLIVLFAM